MPQIGTCEQCHETFSYGSQMSPRHYCSMRCYSMARRSDPVVQFWLKVNKHGEVPANRPDLGPCWIWEGARGRYGHFKPHRDEPGIGAHRYAYSLTYGALLPAIQVLHHCDIRLCVNPAHLFAGTQRDNIRDMDSKGRRNGRCPHPNARGELNLRAKLTNEAVREMRTLHAGGQSIGPLARQFGVDYKTASSAIKRHSWRHIE